MGFFNVLGEIGKNSKNFTRWEKEEKDKLAQREALHEKHPHTEEEIEKARQLGENVINIIDTMDNHSESVAENVETAVAPIVSITPMLGALGTGILSYKGILKPTLKKYNEFDKTFNETEEVKDFYQKLKEYNKKRWAEKKSKSYYDVTSWADNQFHESKKIKDASLKAEAERLSKKYLKKTAKYRKSMWGGILAIPAALIASFVGATIYATKLQVDSSKIARFQARKALEDPKAFVNYTPEQIAQAQAEIDANPQLKKAKQKEKLKQGFFKSLWRVFKDRKEYKASKFADTDDSKIVTRPLTEAEIKQAERDKEVIQRTIKIINNEAEKYSENMEVAAEVLINGSPWFGAAVGGLTGIILDKSGLINKVAERTVKKNGSSEAIKAFNEFKEVKKMNPLYHGRFLKFMKKLKNDLKAKNPVSKNLAELGEGAVKKGKLKGKDFVSLAKAAMIHRWVGTGTTALISSLITGGLGLWMGLKLQKSAARAGRFTAKRELEKDPKNFIGYTQEEYNEVQDVKNTKKEESKFKQYALFIPRVIKQYWEYDKYRRGQFKEEKLLREQLMKQEVTSEQLKDARNLQRKLFNTFEKVDDNSQIYSESTEAAIEIAQPFVQYAGYTAMFSPLIYVMVQGLRGKMSPAQITSKFSGWAAKLTKGGKSKIVDKYLESVNRNISRKVQGQYVDKKPLGILLKDIKLADDSVLEIICKSWSNLRGSTKNLRELSNQEINNEIYNFRQFLKENADRLQAYCGLADKKLPDGIKDSLKNFDSILAQIEKMPKEEKIDILDVLLNPKTIESMPKERFNAALSNLENIVFSMKNQLSKYLKHNETKLKEIVDKEYYNLIETIGSYQASTLFFCVRNHSYLSSKEIKEALQILSNKKVQVILRRNMKPEEFKKLMQVMYISKPIKELSSDILRQIPVGKFEEFVLHPEIEPIIKKVLEPKQYEKIIEYIDKAKGNPNVIMDEIIDKETIVKLIKIIEKKPETSKSIFDKPILEMLPQNALARFKEVVNPESFAKYRVEIKEFADQTLSKYLDEKEIEILLKHLDDLVTNPEMALKDTTTRQITKNVLNKLEKIKITEQIPEGLQELGKKFKLDFKVDKDGNATLGNIFAEIRKIPQNLKAFRIKDYANFIPQSVKDPKKIVSNLKAKVTSMSEAEFTQLMEGRMESLDKKTMLKILGDFEKVIDNVPKEKLNKIWNTLVKEFNEHPDEFMKLMQKGGIKELILTPELKKALLAAGISWTTFMLGATYAVEAWLAEMQLKAGRLGVMKSLEELDDVRYYANVEKDEI